MSRSQKKPVQIVLENGNPSAVIIDIDDYRELLEILEDVDDLQHLEEMRKKSLVFKTLDDFLEE